MEVINYHQCREEGLCGTTWYGRVQQWRSESRGPGYSHFVFSKFPSSAVAEHALGHRRRSCTPPGRPPRSPRRGPALLFPAARGGPRAPLPAGRPALCRRAAAAPERRGGDAARPPLGPALLRPARCRPAARRLPGAGHRRGDGRSRRRRCAPRPGAGGSGRRPRSWAMR